MWIALLACVLALLVAARLTFKHDRIGPIKEV